MKIQLIELSGSILGRDVYTSREVEYPEPTDLPEVAAAIYDDPGIRDWTLVQDKYGPVQLAVSLWRHQFTCPQPELADWISAVLRARWIRFFASTLGPFRFEPSTQRVQVYGFPVPDSSHLAHDPLSYEGWRVPAKKEKI